MLINEELKSLNLITTFLIFDSRWINKLLNLDAHVHILILNLDIFYK